MPSTYPTVPVKAVQDNGRHFFQIYGKLFEFHAGQTASREQAKRDAEQFGLQRQEMLAQKVGRPLTDREKRFGTIDRPPAPDRGVQILDSTNRQREASNPYTPILARLRKDSERSITNADRGQIERRLKMYGRLEQEWEAKQTVKVAGEQNANDPNRPRAIEHARIQLDLIQRDPSATPEDLWAAEDRLKAIEGKGTVAGYWSACREAGLPADILTPAETPAA